MEKKEFKKWLEERFLIEREKFDRSGVYAYTQRIMAYNSNKIEGSTLTEEQTASLFDDGILLKTDDYYRAKDVEEMNGHFLMFHYMLDTLHENLSEEMIKKFHYELKAGVFEDRANGYEIGNYKNRPNRIGVYDTVEPANVADEMGKLLVWYAKEQKTMETLAKFHARYENIHCFQDGNGRTGRMILFRESLKSEYTLPVIVFDKNRERYLEGFQEYRNHGSVSGLKRLFEEAAEEYYKECAYYNPKLVHGTLD